MYRPLSAVMINRYEGYSFTTVNALPEQTFRTGNTHMSCELQDKMGGAPRFKPEMSQLWTSSLIQETDGQYTSAWVYQVNSMVSDHDFVDDHYLHVLTMAHPATILVINGEDDLFAMMVQFPSDNPFSIFDWKKIEETYDAVHLTSEAAATIGSYIGWDCESTVWLKWVFAMKTERIHLSSQEIQTVSVQS